MEKPQCLHCAYSKFSLNTSFLYQWSDIKDHFSSSLCQRQVMLFKCLPLFQRLAAQCLCKAVAKLSYPPCVSLICMKVDFLQSNKSGKACICSLIEKVTSWLASDLKINLLLHSVSCVPWLTLHSSAHKQEAALADTACAVQYAGFNELVHKQILFWLCPISWIKSKLFRLGFVHYCFFVDLKSACDLGVHKRIFLMN